MIKIIVAYDENKVIGKDGGLPWDLPKDRLLFKKLTDGHAVIMGNNTWKSLPKPLKNRLNIVITRSVENGVFDKGIYKTPSIDDAIEVAESFSNKTFVIGGEKIYKEFLDRGIIDNIIVTHVKGKHEGDVFFPKHKEEWTIKDILYNDNDFITVEYGKDKND